MKCTVAARAAAELLAMHLAAADLSRPMEPDFIQQNAWGHLMQSSRKCQATQSGGRAGQRDATLSRISQVRTSPLALMADAHPQFEIAELEVAGVVKWLGLTRFGWLTVELRAVG